MAAGLAGTALLFHPGLHDLFRFRVPKTVVLAAAGAAAAAGLARRSGWRWGTFDLALFAYFGFGIASMAVYGRVWTSGASWLCQELAAALLLWGTSAAVATRPDRRRLLLEVAAWTAAAVAAVAVGEALGLVSSLTSRARPAATLGNRNWVGAYIALSLPAALAPLVSRPSAAGALRLGLLNTALVLTRCRGAWLAVGATAVLAGLYAWHGRRPGGVATETTHAGWLPASVAVVVGVAVAVLTPWPGLAWTERSPYASSLRRLLALEEGTGALRRDELRMGLAVVGAQPWLGVGPRQWHDARDAHAHAAAGRHAEGAYGNPVPHSVALQAAVETGLFGLAALTSAAWLLAGASWRRLASNGEIEPAAAVGTLTIAGIQGLVEPLLYNLETLTLVAVAAGFLRDRGRWQAAPVLTRGALVAGGSIVLGIAFSQAAGSVRAGASLSSVRQSQRWYPLPEVNEDLALHLTRQGRCAEAAGELELALRWNPHHTTPLYQAALCAAVEGDAERARVLLGRIALIEPHDHPRIARIRDHLWPMASSSLSVRK